MGIVPKNIESSKIADARINKAKIARQLNIIFIFVIAIGLVVFFLPVLKQYSAIGKAIVIIGALGMMVTKTYLRKYKQKK